MQGFIEKLIGRLEEERAIMEDKRFSYEYESPWRDCYYKTKGIINELAEESKLDHENVMSQLLNGDWVNTDDVQRCLGITFKEGLHIFDFSRTAEWNPEPLNGQKITTRFRLKGKGVCEWKHRELDLLFPYATSCGKDKSYYK